MPDNVPPLHDLNPTRRFSNRAEDYVRFRPGYPPAAIDIITDGIRAHPDTLLAEIGAGTGICTRLLAPRGYRVVAIEPNPEMRAAATATANVEWHSGTAEETGLADQSVDAVICAQAYHWFRAADALREFARILKPKGRLALMWNSRDAADPLTAGYRQAILDVNGEHPAERREFDPDSIPCSGLFLPCESFEFPNSQRLDLEGLLGRAMSASCVPKSGAPHRMLVERLGQLHAEHADSGGLVSLKYVTQVYRAVCGGTGNDSSSD